MESTLFDGVWSASIFDDSDQNYSSGNGSIFEDEEEFPHWQVAMAVRVLLIVFVMLPINIFLNISVLITFFTHKSLLKPINMIHIVLVGELFVIKNTFIVVALFVFPNVIRYCVCIDAINNVYFPLTAFNIVFVNVVLTCLSIVQFLIIKGKKKLVGWKVVSTLVVLSIFYSLLWVNIFPLCTALCQGIPGSTTFSTYTVLFVGLIVVVILPCISAIFLILMWSCFIFKKSYIGDDNHLNRRIISLPVIMPVVTIFATVFYFILREAFQNVLLQIVTSYYPNWVLLSHEILGHLLEGSGGFIYPLVLLYSHPQLRSAWSKSIKKMLRCNFFKKKTENRVHPEPESQTTNTTTLTKDVM